MSKFKAEFYKTRNDEKPAKDFILTQDNKMQAKLFHLVEILEEYGNQLREPYSKPLGDGIFELRAKVGSDISRVLYFFLLRRENNIDTWFCKENAKDTTKRNQEGKENEERFYRKEW